MFRARDPQESLWQSQFLVTPKKAKRLEGSWAEVFRNEALPLIDEDLFAPMYCADNGRPNRAVQTVLGVHLLKEMFNFTDGEALEQLEFNLLWHHALRLDIEETHLPQKTLHNFRVRLMQHDGGRLAFQETTDRIIQALGIRTGKQRLDSTHIMSNIATLTRLGLFCETMRLFLRVLRWERPSERRPVRLRRALLRGSYSPEADPATGLTSSVPRREASKALRPDAIRPCAAKSSTGGGPVPLARLQPSWRTSGCSHVGCCWSSAMWANTRTDARGTMMTMLGNARCPWP